MFSIGLHLNFDPSHLIWIGIDPVAAVKPYVDHIPHAQAKDIQVLGSERLNRYGFFGRTLEREGRARSAGPAPRAAHQTPQRWLTRG